MSSSRFRWSARPRGRADHGQVLPLVAIVMLTMAGIAVVVGYTGEVLDDRAQARTAADAAALAGVVEGVTAARDLAEQNGAMLESFEIVDGEAVVVVRVGRSRARAQASATPIFEESKPIP